MQPESIPSNPTPAATPPAAPSVRSNRLLLSVLTLVAVALIAVGGLAAYNYGYTKGQSAGRAAALSAAPPSTDLHVPPTATIISQCAKGRGTQYVLAKDIPQGPVYNVYKGKVIGLEFMVGKDDLATNKSLLSLPLFGNTYDHLDIGLLSQGHAGYPVPHYHVDLYKISPAESAAITCS